MDRGILHSAVCFTFALVLAGCSATQRVFVAQPKPASDT
jgi:hypothetical protein